MKNAGDFHQIQISAVIPTYNRGNLIERAIKSAFSQSFSPSEIIIVDDGSVDNTKEIVSRFGEPVRYFYQENAGSAVARNHGVKEARSDWVAFLDSDDLWAKDHLLRMAKAIASTSGKTNYCFADTLEPENRGGELLWTKIGFAVEEPFKLFADGTDIVLMRGNQPMMLQSSVIKKDAFDSCGGFLKELRYRDDTHLFMRLGLGQPICAVAGCGAVATADDVVENRLTLTFDHTEAGAYMNVIMYNDLLQTLDDLSEKSKSELRRRLGGSLRVMARRSWEQGEHQKAAYYLTRAAFVDPQRLIQRILTKIK